MSENLVDFLSGDTVEVSDTTVDPPPQPTMSSVTDTFDIFSAVSVDSPGAQPKQDDRDLFGFDPFSMDNLSIPAVNLTAGVASSAAEDPTSPAAQSPNLLSPMVDIPVGGITTDNSCANLLDFDVLGGVSEVTDEKPADQPEKSTADNWGNLDSVSTPTEGDGTASVLGSGTSASLNPFAVDGYMDPLMEPSSPSPLMTPEVGSSNPLTPEEYQSSDSDCPNEGRATSESEDSDKEPGSPASAAAVDIEAEKYEELYNSSDSDNPVVDGKITASEFPLTDDGEVNAIVTEMVDVPSYTPGEAVLDVTFDQSPPKESVTGPSKTEAIHRVRQERLQYSDSVGSCDSAASYPFTPTNSIADGFQPVREPFILKDEILADKIEKSLPSVNVQEVGEGGVCEEEGVGEMAPGEGNESGNKIEGSCSESEQLPLESPGNYQLSQQDENNRNTRTEESFIDSFVVTGPTFDEAAILKPKDETNLEEKRKARALQLALAMNLEESSIDDYDNGKEENPAVPLDEKQSEHTDVQATQELSLDENVIERAIGQRISEATPGHFISNDGDRNIDLETKDIDSYGDVEIKAQGQLNTVDDNEAGEVMSTDTIMSEIDQVRENISNSEGITNFTDDFSTSVENDSAIQQQSLPTGIDASYDRSSGHQIAEGVGASREDGPVVHSRQNYQDLLSEENVTVRRSSGTVVTFVNVENLITEDSMVTTPEEIPVVNGNLYAENEDSASEEDEELREFVDHFINKEVIPAAMETLKAEQEIVGLIENGDDHGNGAFVNDRFAGEKEDFSSQEEQDITIDSTPESLEELPNSFVRLQIEGQDEIVQSCAIDKSSQSSHDNFVITEVDTKSQGIFDILPSAESTQIVPDIKSAPSPPHSPEVHGSGFNTETEGVGGQGLESSAGGYFDSETSSNREYVNQEVEIDSETTNPFRDPTNPEITLTTSDDDNHESRHQDTMDNIVHSDDTNNATAYDPNLDLQFGSRSRVKNGFHEVNPPETSEHAVAYQIAQRTMNNDNVTYQQQPTIVVDEYICDAAVPMSASTSSMELVSESTEISSSVSHSTVTSNEGEIILEEDSENLVSSDQNDNVAPGPIHGYDNQSYQSSGSNSSSDDEAGAAVHGAAVEGGKLVYSAGSDVEAAQKFAQDVIRNSVEKYEASKIVKAATEAAIGKVKSDEKSFAACPEINEDLSAAVVTSTDNFRISDDVCIDKGDNLETVDYHSGDSDDAGKHTDNICDEAMPSGDKPEADDAVTSSGIETQQTEKLEIEAGEDLELELHKQHMAELEAAGGVGALPEISEFQMPESAMPHELTRLRATSGVSTQSSELSDSIEDFVARMRTETGVSSGTTASSDLEENTGDKTRIEAAKTIVQTAVAGAVQIIEQEKLNNVDKPNVEQLDNNRIPYVEDLEPGTETEDMLQPAFTDPLSTTMVTTKDANDNTKSERPSSLENSPKKKIMPISIDLTKDDAEVDDDAGVIMTSLDSSDIDVDLRDVDDVKTPDDLNTPEALNDVFEGELEWNESEGTPGRTPVEPIPEYTAQEELEDERNWRAVTIGDKKFKIDMKVIEPYKKVLSHGGYYGDGFNALVVFAGCYLPDKSRRDYHYVMDNLFLYVVSTLELLVVEDYMIVYFHGATPKQKMPSLRWLKRCYEMIDRRLKKNLKGLLVVHPTLWLRTIVLMTRPFVSAKFAAKMHYIRTLEELHRRIPTEYIYIPDEIKQVELEVLEEIKKEEEKHKSEKKETSKDKKQKVKAEKSSSADKESLDKSEAKETDKTVKRVEETAADNLSNRTEDVKGDKEHDQRRSQISKTSTEKKAKNPDNVAPVRKKKIFSFRRSKSTAASSPGKNKLHAKSPSVEESAM